MTDNHIFSDDEIMKQRY